MCVSVLTCVFASRYDKLGIGDRHLLLLDHDEQRRVKEINHVHMDQIRS